jgi:thiamine transport system substrate-binding protein
MSKVWWVGVLGVGALLAGFGDAGGRSLTVITHDSFNLDKALVRGFERRTGATLRFVKGGDAGAMTNKLILSKKNPIADVVYGIDNALLGRAVGADLLEAYRPKAAAGLDKALLLDEQWRITPVDYGYVALNYDKSWFSVNNKPLPQSLQDLTGPEYKGLVVVENPATSSPGLAFYLATVKSLGAEGALSFWQKLRANDVKVAASWDAAYYTEFTKNGGRRPIVVGYASSPAAEVFYSQTKLDDAPTANLLLPGSSWLQVEGVAILKGTKNRELAQQFVEFMLQRDVQSDIPTQMWVYPVLNGVKLNDVYRFAEKPVGAQIAAMQPATIAKNSSVWVTNWTKVVLQGADPSSLR